MDAQPERPYTDASSGSDTEEILSTRLDSFIVAPSQRNSRFVVSYVASVCLLRETGNSLQAGRARLPRLWYPGVVDKACGKRSEDGSDGICRGQGCHPSELGAPRPALIGLGCSQEVRTHSTRQVWSTNPDTSAPGKRGHESAGVAGWASGQLDTGAWLLLSLPGAREGGFAKTSA